MPHISDVRAAKSAFQLSNVLTFVTQTVGSTVGKGNDAASPWDAVGNFLAQIIAEAGRIVPMSLETENTVKSMSMFRIYEATLSLTTSSLRHRALGAPHRRD